MESCSEWPSEFFGRSSACSRGLLLRRFQLQRLLRRFRFGSAIVRLCFGGAALGCGTGALGSSFATRSGSLGAGVGTGCGVGGATLRSIRGSTCTTGGLGPGCRFQFIESSRRKQDSHLPARKLIPLRARARAAEKFSARRMISAMNST